MHVSGRSRISHGGGVDLVRGAMDPRSGYIPKILHVKTKESGPVGGGARRARPPRSANACKAVQVTGCLGGRVALHFHI